jgi:hypothetical protein
MNRIHNTSLSDFLSHFALRLSVFILAGYYFVGVNAHVISAAPINFTATTTLVNGALGITAKNPITANSSLVIGGGGGVDILGNNGSGNFSSTKSFPGLSAMGGPNMAIGDFNGDGYDDIAGIGFILWGGIDGSYTRQDITSPLGSNAIAAGDINGDGISDLAFTQRGDNTVTIWLGMVGTTGSWAPSATEMQPVGANPFGLAIGDLNGDGRGEVVTANAGSNSITVYSGSNTSPYVTNRNDLATAIGGYPTPEDVTIADVNGDGKLDVITVGRSPGQISTFLNDGLGNLGSAIISPINSSSWDPRASAVADFNGDGYPDVVIPIQWDLSVGHAINQVAILFGDNTGHFKNEQDFAVGNTTTSQPDDVVAGDFNGDGLVDFAVSNGNENTITVMLQYKSSDSLAPVVTANLTPIESNESDKRFVVTFSATDNVGVTQLSANLNGIPVSNGQTVELKLKNKEQQVTKLVGGIVRIEATSFLLTVTASDSVGNIGSATATPVF